VEGDNKPGIGAELTGKLAGAGISLRGLSAAVVGERFIMYLALDAAADAQKAMSLLQAAS
jgi:predicted amino acid-binding ACT domain protein